MTQTANQPKIDNGPDMQEERRRREREKEAVMKGYLRQAIDAEKQEKVEAAQWNYQKVLEMEPENRIALQRLGIIAANLGNDQVERLKSQRRKRTQPSANFGWTAFSKCPAPPNWLIRESLFPPCRATTTR